MQKFDIKTFQGLILALQDYWARQGCVIIQPLDMEVGAGTFHPMTFLRSLGPEPISSAYVQPCRRPTDGRGEEYGTAFNPFWQARLVETTELDRAVSLLFQQRVLWDQQVESIRNNTLQIYEALVP